jgi:hypothetical protein
MPTPTELERLAPVVWAGPGGLWASADMNDFLEPKL